MEIDEAQHTIVAEDSEAASTDLDQDNSMELSSDSSDDSDDLKMDEDQMSQFNTTTFTPTTTSVTNPAASRRAAARKITKSKLESTINKSLTLRNPGELITDFYISNMNYAMRYSVEYIQSVAKDIRRQREQSDSFINLDANLSSGALNRLVRSVSVDRLYAVRREQIRYVFLNYSIFYISEENN